MKHYLWTALLVATAAGCGKKKPDAPPTATAAATVAPAKDAGGPPPETKPPEAADSGAMAAADAAPAPGDAMAAGNETVAAGDAMGAGNETVAAGAPSADAILKRFAECGGFAQAKDLKGLEGCFTADAVGEITGAAVFNGAAKIANELFAPFLQAFGEAKFAPQLLLVNGLDLASVVSVSGVHSGPFMGVEATKKPIGFVGMRVVKFDATGTQMTLDRHTADIGTVLSQIGASPAPARPVPEVGKAEPEVVVAKNDDVEKKNLEVVKEVCAKFDAHDVAGSGALVADDFVMHDLTSPEDLKGKPAYEALLKDLFGAMPDIAGTCTGWAAGDYVVNQVDWTATNKGDFPMMKLKATGKSLKIHDAEIYRLKDGKVVEYWRFSNGLAFAMQLGLVPPSAGAKSPDAPVPPKPDEKKTP